MSTVHAFVSGTLATVDAVIGNFVQMAYQHFIQGNATFITLLFTVYVMFIGYRILLAPSNMPASTIIRQMILMLCVYGLLMNWKLYHLFVYRIFTEEPGNITKVLIGHTGHANIADSLDDIYATICQVSAGLWGQINFSAAGIAFIVYAALVFFIGNLMCVFALLLFIYAKMMMAIALALGPLFILFILWEPTKGIFTAWLNTLITTALIPIITSAILILMLSVIHTTLPQMKVPADQLLFYSIAPFLSLSIATTMLLSQVFRICSAFGGGITLASLSTGAMIVREALQRTGQLGRNLGQLGSIRSGQLYGARKPQ